MLARRLAVAIGLLFAVLGSQLPEFAQQYRQRLGGALEELRRVISAFDAEASAENLTRQQGVEKLAQNADPLARQRASAIEQDAARVERLAAEQNALRAGGPGGRLVAMARNFDPAIAGDTLSAFEPAVPLTTEAIIIAAAAFLAGWWAAQTALWPLRRHVRTDVRSSGR